MVLCVVRPAETVGRPSIRLGDCAEESDLAGLVSFPHSLFEGTNVHNQAQRALWTFELHDLVSNTFSSPCEAVFAETSAQLAVPADKHVARGVVHPPTPLQIRQRSSRP